MSNAFDAKWDSENQRWLRYRWSDQHKQYYRQRVDGEKWEFLDWHTPETPIHTHYYDPKTPGPMLFLFTAYQVRPVDFFSIGRVFGVHPTQCAGAAVTQHPGTLTFIVVRENTRFCFAVPVYAEGEKGTFMHGIESEQHAIVYSRGMEPQALPSESQMTKSPICVEMSLDILKLPPTTRISFGIHFPIPYHTQVVDIGQVIENDVAKLLAHWWAENNQLSKQVLSESSATSSFQSVKDPSSFFSEGRVFRALWPEPEGTIRVKWFAVVKSKPVHSVCLEMNNFENVALEPNAQWNEESCDVTIVGYASSTDRNDHLSGRRIYIKTEFGSMINVKYTLRMNFGMPYTVEHSVRVCNIGRVMDGSIGLMEHAFAQSLGFQKAN
ncbi:hypothetical protein IQ07DRAFT_649098 [Pyrenochaeta sp. DS3sAY3a]|nr:hypothetical protein IQ07DRAFT_649098 [Pyrenochaeta sp. DS3sAY3a]